MGVIQDSDRSLSKNLHAQVMKFRREVFSDDSGFIYLMGSNNISNYFTKC